MKAAAEGLADRGGGRGDMNGFWLNRGGSVFEIRWGGVFCPVPAGLRGREIDE